MKKTIYILLSIIIILLLTGCDNLIQQMETIKEYRKSISEYYGEDVTHIGVQYDINGRCTIRAKYNGITFSIAPNDITKNTYLSSYWENELAVKVKNTLQNYHVKDVIVKLSWYYSNWYPGDKMISYDDFVELVFEEKKVLGCYLYIDFNETYIHMKDELPEIIKIMDEFDMYYEEIDFSFIFDNDDDVTNLFLDRDDVENLANNYDENFVEQEARRWAEDKK